MSKTASERRLAARQKATRAGNRNARNLHAAQGQMCLTGLAFFCPLLLIIAPFTETTHG